MQARYNKIAPGSGIYLSYIQDILLPQLRVPISPTLLLRHTSKMSFSYIALSAKDPKFRKLPQSEDDSTGARKSFEQETPPPQLWKTCCVFVTSVSIFVVISISFWVGTIWGARVSSLRTVDWSRITQYCMIPTM